MSYDMASVKKRYRQMQLAIFSRKNSAFLAPLLCSLKIEFQTAEELDIKNLTEENWYMGVTGNSLKINPNNLMKMSLKDSVYMLEHELWHIGRLHHQRKGTRDNHLWNMACDYVINLSMVKDGCEPCSIPGLLDSKYDGLSEEQVYKVLYNDQNKPPVQGVNSPEQGNDIGNGLGTGSNGSNNNDKINDLLPCSEDAVIQEMNSVIKAKQQANLSGGFDAGSIAGDLTRIWDNILAPKLPWESILHNLMKDLLPKQKSSWKRRNRRFSDIHLPSMVSDQRRLSNIVYAIDTSGSVDKDQLDRINSEIKYVHDKLKPKKITVIQFDHKLQDEKVFTDKDDYIDVELKGGGGTSYVPVKDYVDSLDTPPEGLVIFTDLYCDPMRPLKNENIPVFWVAVNTPKKEIPFGEYIPAEI